MKKCTLITIPDLQCVRDAGFQAKTYDFTISESLASQLLGDEDNLLATGAFNLILGCCDESIPEEEVVRGMRKILSARYHDNLLQILGDLKDHTSNLQV